ncbi:MAG TPA: hypothetical protein VIL69_05935 [Roseomonas sp.]|jgi:hypothetical protein
MPDCSRTAVAPYLAAAEAIPSRLRRWLQAARSGLRATWRRWSYRPERHYLRGASRRGLVAFVLLAVAAQAVSNAAEPDALRLHAVAARWVTLSPVLRDGPNAPPAQLTSIAHPCEVTLRLDSGAILPVFLAVVERTGRAASRPETMACPENRGAGLRQPRHQPVLGPGPVRFL